MSWSWLATLMCLGRVLFCSFSDLVLSKTMELNPIALFCSSLVAFTAVRLSLALFFNFFGCLVVNFFVRCTTIWLQVEELATLWISLGRGLGDFRCCTYVASLDICIQSDYPFVFRWNCFSRYARCRCQVARTSAYTHPSICFRTEFRHICWVLLRFLPL